MDKHLLLKHLHTIITPLQHLISKCAKSVNGVYPDKNGNVQIPVGSIQMQADWNENDETSAAHVRNRTHYTDAEGAVHPLDDAYIPDTIQRRLINNPDSLIEQIETITLTESAAIERSAEPDGTAYAFKRLVLMFETPADAVVTAGNIYFYSGDAGVGLGYLPKKDAGSSVSYLMNDCGPDAGRWITKYMGGWTGNGNGVYTNNENRRRWLQYAVADYPTLTKVTIPTLPAGTTVQIWGVRAKC